MEKLKNINRKDEGFIYPMILGFVIVLFFIFMLILEYMHFMTFFAQIDSAIQRSVSSVAVQNWENVYQGVREGYAGGNVKEELTDEWAESLNGDNIMAEAQEMLGLDLVSGKYIRQDDEGYVMYTINPTTVKAKITNVPIQEGGISNVGTGKGLTVEVTYKVAVAWFSSGAWGEMSPLETTRTVKVQYKPKY